MKNTPNLNHKIVEKLFEKLILTQEELDEILSCDKATLTEDLLAIVQFCDKDLDELDKLDDSISYNLLIYALFLLKEIESPNQLNVIIEILKWSEDKNEFWFGDLFTEYFWNLVYYFGQHQIEDLVTYLKQEEQPTFSKEQVALALYHIYLKKSEKRSEISNCWTDLLMFTITFQKITMKLTTLILLSL